MATKNTNLANISYINENLNADYPALAAQWQKLRARVLVYGSAKGYDSFTAAWFTNENTNRVFREIRRGIAALKELKTNNDLSLDEKEKISIGIRQTIDAELCFLELKQQVKLAKDQKQFRPEINELTLALKAKTQAARQMLAVSTMPENLKSHASPKIFRYYKRANRFKLNFDNYLTYATNARNLIELAHHSAKIVDTATQVSSMMLQAVPALYAITVAATYVIGAARSWWNHQSNKKKALSTGLAVAAIGVIAISGALPAVGVFITGALAVAGTFMDRIKPTIDLFRLLKAKENELAQTEAKIATLNESNSLTIKLDQNDVTTIQRKLESHLAEAEIKPEAVIELRKLLTAPDITVEKLATNALLQSATNTQDAEGLKRFLIQGAQAHKATLENDIKTLKSQRPKSTTLAFNGGLSAVGAILCCIPTPPTLLAGVSILAFTTAVNLVVTYDLIPKTMNFFKNLFRPEKNEAKPAEVRETNSFKHNPGMKHLHSTLNTQERKPTQEPVITPDKSRPLYQQPETRPTVVKDPEIRPGNK